MPDPRELHPGCLTLCAACRLTGRSRYYALSLAARGGLEILTIGGVMHVRRGQLDALRAPRAGAAA